MKVILTEKVDALGDIGDIVEVADGYGRNYLIPQGFAVQADSRNIKMLEHHKRMMEQKRQKIRREKEDLAAQLNKITLKIFRKVADENRIFGSVNVPDIIKALKKGHGIKLEKKQVELEKPIKELGEHFIPIKVEADIEGRIRLLVEAEE